VKELKEDQPLLFISDSFLLPPLHFVFVPFFAKGRSVAWNNMGTKLATCSSDKTAKIWSVMGEGKGREVATLSGHTASVEQILWSATATGDDVIVTSSLDKTVRFWDARLASSSSSSQGESSSTLSSSTGSASCVARIHLPSTPINVDLHPSGTALAVLTEETHYKYALRIYDVRKLSTKLSTVSSPSLSAKTRHSPSTGYGESDTASSNYSQIGKPIRTYSTLFHIPKDHETFAKNEILNQGRFSPWGYHYITAARNSFDEYGKIHIMECTDMFSSQPSASNAGKFYTLVGHTCSTNCLCFSPCGRYMATGGSDATVCIWETNGMVCTRTMDRLNRPIQSVSFSHDSKLLASSSRDESKIDIADVQTGQKICDVESSRYGASDMEWNPKGYALAFACYCPEINVKAFGERRLPVPPTTVTVVKVAISNT